MRRLAAGLGALVVGLLSASCNGPLISANMTQGSGNVTSESRQVSGFNEVQLTMSGDMTIEQTGTEALTIQAEDNIIPLITTDVSNNRLTIGTKPNTSFSTKKGVHIRVSVKDLSYIGDSASGNVTMQSVKADQLTLEATGSGNINVSGISTSTLTGKASGSGSVTASGQADNLTVTCSGSGGFNGNDLASKSAKVDVSGSGDATVRVSDSLDAHTSGSGSVKYIGSPANVSKSASGSGTVQQIGTK